MHSRHLVARAVVAAAAVLLPHRAAAQGEAYVTVSLSTTQVYEGNVFATPSALGPERDLSSRLGPSFESGFTSTQLKLVGRYSLEAERYLNVVELNRNIARQDGVFELRWMPIERLEVGAAGFFVTTQTPSELNLQSNVVVGRNPADRETGASSLTYRPTGRTQLTTEYSFTRDALLAESTATQTSETRWEHHSDLRNTYRIGYRFRRVAFIEGPTEIEPIDFHLVTIGWAHSMAPGTTIEFNAGPQLSDTRIRPEVSAQFRRAVTHGELAIYFSRTESTVIGERGVFEVYNASVSGRYRAARRLMLVAAPTYSYSVRGDSLIRVYAADLSAITEITPRVTLVTSGHAGRQLGALGSSGEIPFYGISMKLTVATSRKTFFDPMKPASDQGVKGDKPKSEEAVKPPTPNTKK